MKNRTTVARKSERELVVTRTALLDRLAHHATVITTKGKSYRMRKRRTPDEHRGRRLTTPRTGVSVKLGARRRRRLALSIQTSGSRSALAAGVE